MASISDTCPQPRVKSIYSWFIFLYNSRRGSAVFLPPLARKIYTKIFASIHIALTGLVLMMIKLHFFWRYALFEVGCIPARKDYKYFICHIFKTASCIPFLLMVSCNACVIARVVYLQRRRRQNRDEIKRATSTMTGILITIN